MQINQTDPTIHDIPESIQSPHKRVMIGSAIREYHYGIDIIKNTLIFRPAVNHHCIYTYSCFIKSLSKNF